MRIFPYSKTSVTIPREKLQELINFAIRNKELLSLQEAASLMYIDTYLTASDQQLEADKNRDIFGNLIKKTV